MIVMCMPYNRSTSRMTTRAPLPIDRDTPGIDARDDIEEEGMRWIRLRPAGPSSPSIALRPPDVEPGITADERRSLAGVGVEVGDQKPGQRS